MGLIDSRVAHTVALGATLTIMAAITGGLAAIVMLATEGIDRLPAAEQEYRYRLAMIATGSLALMVVLLVWTVLRRLIPRSRRRRQPGSDYVNAWKIAGRRAKPVDDETDPDIS